MPLSGPTVPPRAAGDAQSLVILLHGLGDNGAGLIELATPLAAYLPHTAFVSPDAPEAYDMAPGGRQWFGLQDWSPDAIYNGAVRAAPFLHAYLEAMQQHYALPAKQIALLGFSQGCMMALHVGLRRPEALGAVVGFSGALVGPERVAAEIISRPPVLLVHGMMDNVVPYAAMPASAHYLQMAGVAVTTESRAMLGHSIDQDSLVKAAKFIATHV
jgi:phospholipase/carboxylesterase